MIPLNNFRRQWEDTRESAIDAFDCVGESGWYILGESVRAFESSLASVWGVRYCVGVASGMDALEIALRIAGCKTGDKVLTTPLSAFATTLAILRTGATPVFVDTDPFGLLDLEACRRLLQERPDIRFLVPVHLYGNPLDYHALCRLKEEFDLCVVEDCAQSILALSQRRPTGTAGVAGATSFYPTKNLGAMGDGGAIITDDQSFAEMARVLRDYGQTAKYRHDHLGYNSRLDELQAALLKNVYLPQLPRWTAQRRQIAQQYLDGITHFAIRCLDGPDNSYSCRHIFPIVVDRPLKGSFMAHLTENGIGCAEHYPTLIPSQPAMAECEFEMIGDCGNAKGIAETEVSLPIHPYLTEAEVARVIEVCNTWKVL